MLFKCVVCLAQSAIPIVTHCCMALWKGLVPADLQKGPCLQPKLDGKDLPIRQIFLMGHVQTVAYERCSLQPSQCSWESLFAFWSHRPFANTKHVVTGKCSGALVALSALLVYCFSCVRPHTSARLFLQFASSQIQMAWAIMLVSSKMWQSQRYKRHCLSLLEN